MKNSNDILDCKTKEDFYIKLYFNTSESFEKAGIKRAYLDFNRTLRKKSKKECNWNEKRKSAENFLQNRLLKIISANIGNQNKFDLLHRETVVELQKIWDKLTVGQAQKWINMTLKYWLLFGNKRIPDIEKNVKYFHIPLDRIVLKNIFDEKNPKPWSRINDYNKYLDYQKKHRNKLKDIYPILNEFKIFNEND